MNPDNLLRQALQSHATHIAATHLAPPAALVYLRVERRARRRAANRATLPLRIMKFIGILAGILAYAWVLRSTTLHATSLTSSPILLASAASATLLTLLGCYTMLRASRTS